MSNKVERYEDVREHGNRWCRLEVGLRHGRKGLELSICGAEGQIRKVANVEREAQEYWVSYFEEDDEAYGKFCKQHGPMTVEDAARFVLDADGSTFGIDVDSTDGDRCYVVDSCGQITDTLTEFFPEVGPHLRWHLNGMNAGCRHQRARGWGKGVDIALVRRNATDVQIETLDGLELEATVKQRERLFNVMWAEFEGNEQNMRRHFGKVFYPVVTVHDQEVMLAAFKGKGTYTSKRKQLQQALRESIAAANPATKFQSAIFKDSINAPCDVCGYLYGTEWLFEALPEETIQWTRSVGSEG